MALKAYYDGSGKRDNPDAHFLTLAGYAGFDPVWPTFDQLWAETLADRDPQAPYLHMREAMFLQKAFKRTNGWDEGKLNELLMACCFCVTRITSREEWKDKFKQFSCTLDLEAYSEVKREFPDIAKPEKICVDAAVRQMLFEGRREFKDGEVELYFDRNESFRGHVYSEWVTKKRGRKPWWSDMVKTVASARMEDTPGLQAADMVAWLLNRHYSQGDLGNWVGVVNTFLDRADRQYAGYDEIKNYHVERAS